MLETTRLRLGDYYNWPQVVVGKYIQIYRVDPGSKNGRYALLFLGPSRRNSSPRETQTNVLRDLQIFCEGCEDLAAISEEQEEEEEY